MIPTMEELAWGAIIDKAFEKVDSKIATATKPLTARIEAQQTQHELLAMDFRETTTMTARRIEALEKRADTVSDTLRGVGSTVERLVDAVQELNPGLDAVAHKALRRSSTVVSQPTLSPEDVERLKEAVRQSDIEARSWAEGSGSFERYMYHVSSARQILGMEE